MAFGFGQLLPGFGITSADSLAGSYTIREMTGDERSIVLTDRALPYRPYVVTGSQRAKMSRYPGSPIGTLQFLGASEDDATVSGFWKDKYIADGLGTDFVTGRASTAAASGSTRSAIATLVSAGASEPIGSVQLLAELVDDVRRKGQLLEVSWLHVVRRGYLRKFTQRWHNEHDLEWEIDFEWISQKEEQNSQLAIHAPQRDLTTVSETTRNNAALAASAAVPTVTRAFSATQIVVGFVAALQTQADAIATTLQNYVDATTAPAYSLLGALASLQAVVGAGDSLAAYTRSIVDSATLLGADTPAGLDAVSEGQSIGASYSQRQALGAANKARRDAARDRQALLKGVNPDLTSVFYARDNQDLRDASIQFYGTESGWRYLMQYNGLQTSKLSAGQVVLVPKRKSGDPTP